jgi:hypothetical protein
MASVAQELRRVRPVSAKAATEAAIRCVCDLRKFDGDAVPYDPVARYRERVRKALQKLENVPRLKQASAHPLVFPDVVDAALRYLEDHTA